MSAATLSDEEKAARARAMADARRREAQDREAVEAYQRMVQRSSGLHQRIADSHPTLKRGMVWCKTCGRSQKVDPAQCLRTGWPICHGATMSLNDPAELIMSAGADST